MISSAIRIASRGRGARDITRFGAAIVQPAHAYLGQQLLEWAASNIIAPLGLIALVVALAGAFFRPDLAKGGVYAAVICAALFFIIRQANTIIGSLQSN